MTMLVEKLVNDIMELPFRERAHLAHRLIESLDDTQDEDAEARWMQEIDKRSRQIDAGSVACKPIEDVVAAIGRKLRDARSQSSQG